MRGGDMHQKESKSRRRLAIIATTCLLVLAVPVGVGVAAWSRDSSIIDRNGIYEVVVTWKDSGKTVRTREFVSLYDGRWRRRIGDRVSIVDGRRYRVTDVATRT